MNLNLPPDDAAFVEEQIRSGAFSTPEEVVMAALATYRAGCESGDFAPGELSRLLEEGERGGDERGWFTDDEAQRRLDSRLEQLRNRRT